MRKKGFFSKKKAKTFLKGSPGMPAYGFRDIQTFSFSAKIQDGRKSAEN